MRAGNPIETLAFAVTSACVKDLMDVEYKYVDPRDRTHEETRTRRPRTEELRKVELFQQTFGSTALGFGGMGCASITTADVAVVKGPMGDVCVYFSNRFAYRINSPNEQFFEDMKNHHMAYCDKASEQYENV